MIWQKILFTGIVVFVFSSLVIKHTDDNAPSFWKLFLVITWGSSITAMLVGVIGSIWTLV